MSAQSTPTPKTVAVPRLAPKFFAFIGDIHGNIDALTAVLADIEKVNFRGIICLGDIVGYGAEPARCVQRVIDTCQITVRGNHEIMMIAAGRWSEREYGRVVGQALALADAQLSETQMAWLRAQPMRAQMDPISIVHSSLDHPDDFYYISSREAAARNFEVQISDFSFHGHTHVPLLWEESSLGIARYEPMMERQTLTRGPRYAINPGSVGQPRDDNPEACYALFDPDTRIFCHRRVPYDIERAQARILEAGLAPDNAFRLADGR